MKHIETDLVVAGGGIAGMIASLVFAREGFRVVCVEASTKPSKSRPEDLRSTAFLMPAIKLMQQAGIFSDLSEIAAPLKIMRIVDAGGKEPNPRQIVDFDAMEANESQFGWNIPNAPLRQKLLEQIAKNKQVTMLFGDAVVGMTTRMTEVQIRLQSGYKISAHLVVAADGRHSRLRDLAGINSKTLRYGQKALVFQVEHKMPHAGISTEIHRSGGPFTIVPLSGDDQTKSAVVWMTDGPEADRLLSLDDPQFEEALNYRSASQMGWLSLDGPRGIWPIISQHADKLTSQRFALIGEAAHVVPPIGAQGLNMSLADIACLRDLMTASVRREDIGSDQILEQFERKRWIDMRLRVQGIDMLNRASMASTPAIRDSRASLLALLGKTAGLKRTAIKAGLGT